MQKTENSSQQFQELLAHLIARVNKMLSGGGAVYPLSLALIEDGNVEVGVGVPEDQKQLSDVLNAMQNSLIGRVASGEVLATCIAYLSHKEMKVVALLENAENYSATVTFQVSDVPPFSLDTTRMQVEDGSVYIFPVVD